MSETEMKKASALVGNRISILHEAGIVNYYAGGALGFDLAAAATVLNMKRVYPDITLHIALPCPDHMKNWRRSEVELFERVRSRADSVTCVSDSYHKGCMQLRNRYMVDRSSYCIAYMKKKSGGTYNTVSYALKRGIKTVNLADIPLTDQICFDI